MYAPAIRSRRSRPAALAAICLLLLGAGPLPAATPTASRAAAAIGFDEVPGVREFSGRMIVRPLQRDALRDAGFDERAVADRRATAKRAIGLFPVLRYVPQTDEYLIAVPAGRTEQEVAASLSGTGAIQYAEPDWLLAPLDAAVQLPGSLSATAQPGAGEWSPEPLGCPDDPMFPQQWHHQADRMDSCTGWAIHTGKPRVTVAVCDTGIRTTHEDLLLHRLEGYNAVDRLWESQGGQIGPKYPHGTKVTACAAANTNNGVGVAGMGWNLSHRMIRVSNLSTGNAYASDIQHGARTAAEAGDAVINVSYAGVSISSNKTTANYCKSLGSLLLWGAGNESSNLSFSDRDADDLIVVGATNSAEALAYFSNWGTFVDLVAPGQGILTADSGSDSDYAIVEGTSFACPLAAGMCAVLWSLRPTLSPGDVERILKLGADDLGAPGIDDIFGYGRVNVPGTLRTAGTDVPVADISAPSNTGLSPLKVKFLDQSTGVPTSWLWDFGDGTTSTLQRPAHSYASSGAYTVSLTVANELGVDTTVRTDYVLVDVIPPVASFSGTPVQGLSPMIVDFADESTGGIPDTWDWDFGDGGTSTAPQPSHTYTASGIYDVTLTVANAYGSDTFTRTAYVAVDFIPPVADFSGTPTSGVSPYVVNFTDESTAGAPGTWSWYFGDGGVSAAQNPSHTYTVDGTYTVTLTVSNPWGSDMKTRIGYVQVALGKPILANFVGTPTTGTAPLTVDFTDLTIGYPVTWSWLFGDGGSSTLQNPTYTYTTPGLYNVILEVTDGLGDDDNIELEDYILVQ